MDLIAVNRNFLRRRDTNSDLAPGNSQDRHRYFFPNFD